MRFIRPAAAAALTLGLIAGSAPAAHAAPPGNDSYDGRTVIGSVPFSTSVDTSEATTDAEDAAINADCGAPATDASVWFELTAAETGGLVANVGGSDYSAGVLVATGGPGNWHIVACGPEATSWRTEAGQTYELLAFDDQFDGGGNGGTLQLDVEQAPPPPVIEATADPTGTFNRKDGTATVTGTVTCSQAEFAGLFVDLEQRVGRGSVLGSGQTDVVCDGQPHKFAVLVEPFNGTFAGGKTATVTFAFACGAFECAEDFKRYTIVLKGRGA